MQDAVAEVLLERKALVPRRSFSLVASAALHLIVAIAVLMSARRDRLQPQTSIVNIRLAPATAPTVIETPAPPLPKPVPVPPPAAEKPKPVQAEKKPVEKSLFGKSTEKPTEPVPRPASAVPRPSTALDERGTTPGTAGISGLEGGDFPYTIYIDRMLTLIGSHWFRPQMQAEVTTQIYFVIERDGGVHDVKIEKGSGSATFDRAAFRAVIEASPLPPLPFAYSGTYLGVHLTFH